MFSEMVSEAKKERDEIQVMKHFNWLSKNISFSVKKIRGALTLSSEQLQGVPKKRFLKS